MRSLPVEFYHFCQLLLEVPNDECTNEDMQLEPLCTNPNLLKDVRCLVPKFDNDKGLLDISKWKYISSRSNKTRRSRKNANKFNATTGGKGM